jgi:hypothetical protein
VHEEEKRIDRRHALEMYDLGRDRGVMTVTGEVPKSSLRRRLQRSGLTAVAGCAEK